jgi:hypothetical protein
MFMLHGDQRQAASSKQQARNKKQVAVCRLCREVLWQVALFAGAWRVLGAYSPFIVHVHDA